jgi:heat shock protein HspQ
MIQYIEVAQNNRDLANLNAEIAEDSDQAYDHILNAAKSQQQIAVIREDMLADERKDHFLDNLWHRVLIVVGIGAALL